MFLMAVLACSMLSAPLLHHSDWEEASDNTVFHASHVNLDRHMIGELTATASNLLHSRAPSLAAVFPL